MNHRWAWMFPSLPLSPLLENCFILLPFSNPPTCGLTLPCGWCFLLGRELPSDPTLGATLASESLLPPFLRWAVCTCQWGGCLRARSLPLPHLQLAPVFLLLWHTVSSLESSHRCTHLLFLKSLSPPRPHQPQSYLLVPLQRNSLEVSSEPPSPDLASCFLCTHFRVASSSTALSLLLSSSPALPDVDLVALLVPCAAGLSAAATPHHSFLGLTFGCQVLWVFPYLADHLPSSHLLFLISNLMLEFISQGGGPTLLDYLRWVSWLKSWFIC